MDRKSLDLPLAPLEVVLHDGGMSSQIDEHLNLAKQACDLGDIATAESHYEIALQESEQLSEMTSLANVLYELQRFYAWIGDKEKARLMARRFRMVALHYCHKQQDPKPH
jgi:hypothetical protein